MIVLQKNPRKDFVILNLSDINMNDIEWGDDRPEKELLLYTVDRLISETKPDLITVTGDISYAGLTECYEKFGALLESYGIPWAFVWGNHDNQGGIGCCKDQMKILCSFPHCLFEEGDPALGHGNYIIRIDEENKPVYALVMMDSHDREPYTNEKGETSECWGRLNPAQLKWYKETVPALGVRVSLLTHIPLPAYREAFRKAWDGAYDPKPIAYRDTFDPRYWNEGFESSYGACYEDICSYPVDAGEFDALKYTGLTDLVLVGHDHANNFVIPYEGTLLAYATKTGSGCYWDRRLNGGTLLSIGSDGMTLKHILIDPEIR